MRDAKKYRNCTRGRAEKFHRPQIYPQTHVRYVIHPLYILSNKWLTEHTFCRALLHAVCLAETLEMQEIWLMSVRLLSFHKCRHDNHQQSRQQESFCAFAAHLSHLRAQFINRHRPKDPLHNNPRINAATMTSYNTSIIISLVIVNIILLYNIIYSVLW